MTEHVASRTLVKSPPELWAECSDAASLARHLDQFGEIRITRLDPETAVAWEGERARGTVRIEPAGWGTKVILTAVAVAGKALPDAVEAPAEVIEAVNAPAEGPEVVESPAEPPEAAEAEVEAPEVADDEEAPRMADAEVEPDPPARRRRFARLFGFFRAPEPAEVEAPEETAGAEPSPPAPPPKRTARPRAPREVAGELQATPPERRPLPRSLRRPRPRSHPPRMPP